MGLLACVPPIPVKISMMNPIAKATLLNVSTSVSLMLMPSFADKFVFSKET